MKLRLLVLAACTALAVPAVAVAIAPPEPDFGALRRDAGELTTMNPRPFLAKIDASEAALMRGNTCASFNILGALSNQLDAKLQAPPEPDRAALVQLQSDVGRAINEWPPGPCTPPPEPD